MKICSSFTARSRVQNAKFAIIFVRWRHGRLGAQLFTNDSTTHTHTVTSSFWFFQLFRKILLHVNEFTAKQRRNWTSTWINIWCYLTVNNITSVPSRTSNIESRLFIIRQCNGRNWRTMKTVKRKIFRSSFWETERQTPRDRFFPIFIFSLRELNFTTFITRIFLKQSKAFECLLSI